MPMRVTSWFIFGWKHSEHSELSTHVYAGFFLTRSFSQAKSGFSHRRRRVALLVGCLSWSSGFWFVPKTICITHYVFFFSFVLFFFFFKWLQNQVLCETTYKPCTENQPHTLYELTKCEIASVCWDVLSVMACLMCSCCSVWCRHGNCP